MPWFMLVFAEFGVSVEDTTLPRHPLAPKTACYEDFRPKDLKQQGSGTLIRPHCKGTWMFRGCGSDVVCSLVSSEVRVGQKCTPSQIGKLFGHVADLDQPRGEQNRHL